MNNRPEKNRLDGWQMNQQQRRFLESFFSGAEEQETDAKHSAPEKTVEPKAQAAVLKPKTKR